MDEGNFESLFVELIVGDGESITIGVVYLPHRNFNVCEDEISDISLRYDNLIIMGDFDVDIFTRGDEVRSICNRSSLSVVHNSQPTHYCDVWNSTSLIDYFFVTNFENVKCKGQFQFPALNSNHSLIYISYFIPINAEAEEVFYRDIRSLDLRQCISQLHSTDFSNIYENTQPDDQVFFFNSTILSLYENNVPLRRLRKSNSNNWMNHPEIKIARINRDSAFRAMRENRTETSVRTFCICRNKVKSIIRKIRRRSSLHFFSNCDQKQFWKKLRSVGAVNENQTNVVIDPDDFNQYSRMPNISTTLMSFDQELYSDTNGFMFRNVTEFEVFNAMSRLKSNAVGADGIPLKFLKLIFTEIVSHLTYIINSCITRSFFPSEWKVGKVVPIPKIKCPRSVEDFRPITILPCCSKIFEILLKDQMQLYLDGLGIISPFQSGFRKGYNTSALMLDIVESIRSQLEKHLVNVLIFLDFRKAFDSLCHDLLARKLIEQYNFNPLSSKLVFSFLSNRTQFVQIRGQYSSVLDLYRVFRRDQFWVHYFFCCTLMIYFIKFRF